MTAARLACAAILSIILGGCGSGQSEQPRSTGKPSPAISSSISVEELHQLVAQGQDIFLADVRTEREYRQSRLSFASVRIPYDSLKQYAPLLPTDTNTVVYCFCKTGRRSAIAAARLATMGYHHTVNVEGGITAWMAAGYPVVSGANETDSP